jgi:hypothetical protein
LFFLADGDRINVHTLSFPQQLIHAQPVLRIRLPISRSGLSGYINELAPHNVNSILVGFLGSEEIILTASDDGDVVGYYTAAVNRAVQDMNNSSSSKNPRTLEDLETDISPFLIENFGRSAWGLAIHTTARLIAVSANTHRVTIIAFALSSSEHALSGSQSAG